MPKAKLVATNKKILLFSLLAGIFSLFIPVAFSLWEIMNDPVYRPDGSIDDGAERGSGLFLYIFVWPLLAISILWYWAVGRYARKQANKPTSIFKACLLACFLFSFILGVFSYRLGFFTQLQIFLGAFVATTLLMLPGAAVMVVGLRNVEDEAA